MEKSKSKKKLIGIIAGCAMAFILTVVVSVAVTLAYFGDTKSGDTSITMGQALTFSGDVSASTTLTTDKTLPGASSNITVTGTIAQSTTTAYLRVKVTSTGTGANSIVLGQEFTGADGKYVKNGDYYYLTQTADNTKMLVVDATAGNKVISFTVPYSVDAKLTNTVAGQTITVTVTMDIVQSEYFADGTLTAVAALWNDTNTVVG